MFAETHTAVMLDKERNHERALGMNIEVLAVCTLDDEGLITRFEVSPPLSYGSGAATYY